MNEFTLPPSPNWYLSSILACASDGTIAWGARNSVVIAKKTDESKKLDYSIIERAHLDRVTTIAFSPKKEEDDYYRLVSAGDDNIVKVWNLKDLSMELKNTHLDNSCKIIGVDWSKHNESLICYVSEDGALVAWNIKYDTSQLITLGKLTATCLACCPHDSNIVSIGTKAGLIYIVDIRRSGNIIYKLRGHDVEIVSLSWCPVPQNIFESKDTKELFLASGAKDRVVFLWKAGTDGRYHTQIYFPNAPLDTSNHKNRVSASAGNYTAVCWLEPTILLTSSPWGELLLWDLSGNDKKRFTPKLIHAKHGKGLFSIAGATSNKIIEQPAETDNDNWREKINVKGVWTVAQDRQVICCNYSNNETSMEYNIPTQGGFIYCMSACPLDTSQIAFGVGDAMIRLWNLSEPHENVVEVQMLWEKIKGKVRALAWHPEKENLLAFATNEGRVGMFDTNTKKPPILYRQYHRHVVYTIGWGPAPNVKEYALYTCGDGELVYYDPEKFHDSPVSVTKKRDCTEFCWKPDYTLLALGFGDGSISFLNRELKECGHTIHALNKAVQRLLWHPESTSSDLSISPMQNYLAVCVINTTVTIFDISNINVSKENTDSNETSFYKTVATLNGHSDKVVCLAWSPHMSGYLISGSYDYTLQVWKVETQEVIATYVSHVGPVQCCMWSPFSQDLIISGSTDFTLRIWRVSNQKAILDPAALKSSARGKRTKKKKTKEEMLNTPICNGIKVESKVPPPELKASVNKESKKEAASINRNLEEIENGIKNVLKITKKKRTKKTTYFPAYAEITTDNKRWCSSVNNLMNILENDNQDKESGVLNCNGLSNSSNEDDKTVSTSNVDLPILLGHKKNLKLALNHERNLLNSNGQHNIVTEIDFWCGDLKENIQEAMKKKRLNELLVSLSPSISKEFWEEVCEAYIAQLIVEEHFHKAVSYLLCVNKVQEAIDTFVTAKLYKEAYVLASTRLDSNDPIITTILQEWANNAQKDGHFQNAAECYVKLGNYAKAAKLLERRKDIDSLLLAIKLAEVAKDSDLSASLADKAVLEALLISDFTMAKSIMNKHSQVQYREVEVEAYSQLSKLLENVNDETILNWLKGESEIAVLKTLSERFTKCPKKYSLLLQKDVYPLPIDEKMVLANASHQFALYVLSDQEKIQLQHLVKAFDHILQYEKTNFTETEKKSSLIIKYLVLLDNKNFTDPKSIFQSNESGISESLRAYLCYSTITWFHENTLNESQCSESIDSILVVLEKCVNDLLNKESVKFWTTANEIDKLETELSSIIGKLQNTEDGNEDETKAIIERLDQLRNDKKQFLETRISSPNPLFSYGAAMEFIEKVPTEEKRQKITDIVMNAWSKAIS